MRKRIYLHTNTEFSFLYSKIRVNELFELAIHNKLEYLPLTDVNNLYALPYYFELQKKHNIKPIIGIETKIKFDEKEHFKVIIIAKNNQGLARLNQIIFQVSQNNFLTTLLEIDDPNLFVIDHLEKGMKAKNLNLPFGENFYLNSKKQLDKPTVFAPTKRILNIEDNEILKVLEQISGKNSIQNFNYYEYFDDQEFEDLDESVYQTMLNLVEEIDIQPPSNELKLAKFADNSTEIFEKLIVGARFQEIIKFYDKREVLKRIKYEYETIAKLGFIEYFLIIWDALKWARENNIEVGPGRGSASGSLIAYLLHITDVNPLEFNLLFERFLNVDRVSLPDIDIDIQDNKRDLLLEYLKNRYGANNFALISTFQTLASKNSIRDVARILKIPTSDVNKISAALTKNDENLKYAYLKNKKYKVLVDKYPNLHEYASQIEGLPRQVGLHAAGVIIANNNLQDSFPVALNPNGFNQIQFTMNYLERFGLIKIDFLGLKNLTIIQEIENLIPKQYHFHNIVNHSYSKFIDSKTFEMLNNLITNGIFQLESDGMKNAIKLVHVDSFDDLYAIISLFRPGPVQYIPIYGENKKEPNRIEKIHPKYDQIVYPTYGIIVYQEQIMQIAQELTGMSFAQADLLRRAISKKDESQLHSYKKVFFEGGLKNGISKVTLERIYANIEKFADYGFNKSHAVAYALISYKMAFYKARFPMQFYAVLLSNSVGDLLNIKKYVLDAKEQKIKVNSPQINISTDQVEIRNNQLYLPFNMIKGVGQVAVQKIISEKANNGSFNNFIEAYLRLRSSGIGDSVFTLLIKANVFKEFANVATLLDFQLECASIFKIYQEQEKSQKPQTEEEKINLIRNFINENNYQKLEIPHKERNIEEEMQYESELLGDTYNVGFDFNIQQNSQVVKRKKIQEVDLEKSWIVVYVTSAKKHATKNIVNVAMKDETKSIIAYGFTDKIFRLIDNFNPRILLVNISKNEKNFYRIFDWKEIENE
ncbi:DNA polymerase III subunit alpha [Mycoplasmopsis gallopavonis]|uniref:DNA-directed DNA polymerase n=1 Tax=Mycoplasmopsis gallopavonis TaxID=76629 RepID=A0A449AZ62_9BACT|nr:DNA polymerase III subunit alpha [Mycoplasmopsis gallopavonis]RIV16961.1 DNA polymerase III subunit alpha [Mycoplasmopsis gallopavonis]VEU72791.1 DNA polymerase III alpha subunit [Mycoplasmopsis gallopavonis]